MDEHSNSSGTEDYEVGYKKPPKHTQFKPGHSGNPKGRKKGSKNKRYKSLPYGLPEEIFRNAILSEAYRDIAVNENGEQIRIPTVQAILRSIFLKAAKGDVRAQRLATDLIEREEKKNRKEAEDCLTKIMDYKDYWEKKLAKGYSGSIDGPLPGQIKMNKQTGQVEVVGPLTKEEREENEYYKKMLSNARQNLTECLKELEEAKDSEERSWARNEIDHFEKIISLLENIVFEDDEDLSLFQRAKKEGYYDAFMDGPEALSEYFRKKFKLGEIEQGDE